MQAALLGGSRFPPPAARPLMFARLRGAAARGATDTRVALGVQRMTRDIVFKEICVHVLPTPTSEWADLRSSMLDRDCGQGASRVRLRSPQPCQPCVEALQLSIQGAYFAEM